MAAYNITYRPVGFQRDRRARSRARASRTAQKPTSDSPSTAIVGARGASAAGRTHQNHVFPKTLPAKSRSSLSLSYSQESPSRNRVQSR